MNNRFVIMLDGIASRYGQRPSELVGLTDHPAVALSFDIEVACIGYAAEREELAKIERQEMFAPITSVDEMTEFFDSLPDGSLVKKAAEEMRAGSHGR